MKFFEFLRRQVQVARVYGIPVRIDYRWFLIFAVTLWLVAYYFMTGAVRGGVAVVRVEPVIAVTLAIMTTLLLFLSVFGHELAHALMARAEGIETLEIVLHPFGGLARLSRPPDSARAEFRVAIAGPAASFVFALLGFGAMTLAGLGGYLTAFAVFFVIGVGNLLLAFFNLLPGYPLDGGRVLRAYLWHRTGDLTEATRLSSLGGQLIAWTLIVVGAYVALSWGAWFMGMWTVVIGLYLRGAAIGVMREVGAAGRASSLLSRFGGRTAGDAMIAPIAIEPETLVSHFVDHVLPVHRQTVMPVARGGRLHGILTLEDLKQLPRERWARTPVRDVMRVVEANLFVNAHAPLAEAEEIMRANGAGALGVVNRAGELVGFLQLRRDADRSATSPRI